MVGSYCSFLNNIQSCPNCSVFFFTTISFRGGAERYLSQPITCLLERNLLEASRKDFYWSSG